MDAVLLEANDLRITALPNVNNRELCFHPLQGHYSFFNADMAFDTREARKTCFNHGVIPNIPENTRGRQLPKRGCKRLFNAAVYAGRFCAERTFCLGGQIQTLADSLRAP